MLHKYEKIDEAMAACVALEYPLIVLVHGKLPSSLSNAEEAVHGGGTGSVAHTYSFLPPSYNTGTSHAFMTASINGSSSLFTDDTTPFDSTLSAPSQDAANANAALGYLMRPANLSAAAAAADRAAVATAVADGEELTLVNDFPLGSLQGGAAQREALLITLLESRLGSITLLHLIEEGTPDYESFTSAVPVPGANSGATLPRVHIFYAPTVGLSPMVLHGTALTPQNLHNCVQMSMLRPRNRPESTAAAAAASANSLASGLRTFLSTSVSSMNAEYERSRQHTTPSAARSEPAAPSAPSASAAAPVQSSPAVRATGVSRADAFASAHLISVAGLPTSFSTGPIPGNTNSAGGAAAGAVKTILTTPAMTMQTVWRAVEKHLDWAQREVQQAQAVSLWNGVTPPKPGTAFTLTVAPTAATTSAVSVTSLAEAAAVRLQDFPRNTVVQVAFDGASPTDGPAQAPVQQQQQTQQQMQPSAAPPSSTDYVCEGDVCRRRASSDAAVTASPPSAASPPSTSDVASPVASPSSTAAPAVVSSSIKLHCSLPNGKTLDVADLDPAVATLQADVRPAVRGALGYDNFLFVCGYPAKRYSAEIDEPRSLKDVGLARSSALRVVPLDGAGAPNAASGPAQVAQAGPARQMLSNAASSLMGMLGGRRTNPAQSSSPTNNNAAASSNNTTSGASSPPRRTYNSMAEMLAAGENRERETAMERLRQEQQQQQQQQQQSMRQDPADTAERAQGKKSNRYFGGGSTEYIAEDKDEDMGEEDMRRAMEGMTQEQQSAFLREQLQRLVQQHRGAVSEGLEDAEEEGEEEVRGRGAAGNSDRPRAFQGQGRRLAGDGTSTTSVPPTSAAPLASSQPPSASDASKAKKEQ